VGAGEALPVPRVAAVRHAALGDHLAAFDAFGGKLVFVAFCTVDVVLLRDERLRPDRILACTANKAFFMPLPCLVLHFLHAGSENVSTPVASRRKLSVVTRTAVNPVGLAAELFVDEARATFVAQETRLVPVLLLVRQVLGVDADDFSALVAVVGEYALVAFDAVRMILPQNVPVSCKTVVAVVAEHDLNLKVGRSLASKTLYTVKLRFTAAATAAAAATVGCGRCRLRDSRHLPPTDAAVAAAVFTT